MASLGSLVIELRECLERIREHGDAYYVYVLRRPDGTPFYVGKGRYDRVARHEYDALKTRKKSYRLNVIRQVVAQGGRIGYEITCFYAEPTEALAAEIDLIQKIGRRDLGTGPLTNKTDGGDGWLNPSDADRARVAAFTRKRMSDPEIRKTVVTAMLSAPTRAARALLGMKTPAARANRSRATRLRWASHEYRARVRAAMLTAARNPEIRARHAVGIARVQSDPQFHERRNAGLRSAETRAKYAATTSSPEFLNQRRRIARQASAEITIARERVKALAISLGKQLEWPHHSSSTRVWAAIEIRLLAEQEKVA